ncbi:MAG TPA: gluconate 2-dehydrogenase subunit 3 family protein [Prolixibacteraceae bacterium]|nr:gluconate 2-dehydrogenase subunit 3 family protein [Prolixibacteraceae bacterium]
MDNHTKLTRRRFIALSLMGTGGICLLSQCVNPPLSRWRFITEDESVLLDALVEQIIPTDEWPGARDAGVTNFIDQQLSGTYAQHHEMYRNGLLAIRETCQTKFQKRFDELPWEEQTQFLKLMEAGKMEGAHWENGLHYKFFGLIRNHTMQGYYGSPRHGGNKNNISYKMLKLDYPVIIGQNRYKS